jgi:hypothetical protein
MCASGVLQLPRGPALCLLGYSWSYFARRIGHLLPNWQPYLMDRSKTWDRQPLWQGAQLAAMQTGAWALPRPAMSQGAGLDHMRSFENRRRISTYRRISAVQSAT